MQVTVKTKKKKINVGVGIILFAVLLTLKLANIVNWSWWWITSPLWIPIALAVLVMLWGTAAMLFEPFRKLDDFFFRNDAHHIVSNKGWQELNKEQDED